jgi:hypothetical protein
MKELVNIQAQLKAPKNQVNKFGGYKYRSCEDIMEAVKPLLSENNCTLTVCDDIVVVAERVYVKATATIRNASGETEQTTAFAREPLAKKGMDEPQVTGTASSYARKYALNGLLAIDDTKDADTNEYKKQTDVPDLPDADTIIVLDQVKQCGTVADLQKLWNELSGWQQNKQFIAAVNKRKKELEK